MIVWGGWNDTVHLNDGGRYNPATDTWTPTTTSGAPAPRQYHTAVWTGTEMIVFGGRGGASGSWSVLGDTFHYTPSRVLYLYQRP
jgi:hypothetical protein